MGSLQDGIYLAWVGADSYLPGNRPPHSALVIVISIIYLLKTPPTGQEWTPDLGCLSVPPNEQQYQIRKPETESVTYEEQSQGLVRIRGSTLWKSRWALGKQREEQMLRRAGKGPQQSWDKEQSRLIALGSSKPKEKPSSIISSSPRS